MRNVLKDISEVTHYWANRVQTSGKASGLSFEGPKLYSYSTCIARLMPDDIGVVLFTNQHYSNTTSKHLSKARFAANHKIFINVNDPCGTPGENMAHFREAIRDALVAAERKGIRQATREALRQQALHIAETANEYLRLLDLEGIEQPVDISNLEAVRAGLVAAEQAKEQAAQKAKQARIEELTEAMAAWRRGEFVRVSLYAVPTMLRLTIGDRPGTVVQTSHGAEIPVADAIKLWPMIERVKRGERDYTPGEPLGAYSLTRINQDGSIVVGCHTIAYGEIEGIAKALGLI